MLLLYLEYGGEINVFCLLQTQSNEGDVCSFPVSKTDGRNKTYVGQSSHAQCSTHKTENIHEVCNQDIKDRTTHNTSGPYIQKHNAVIISRSACADRCVNRLKLDKSSSKVWCKISSNKELPSTTDPESVGMITVRS